MTDTVAATLTCPSLPGRHRDVRHILVCGCRSSARSGQVAFVVVDTGCEFIHRFH
jgi:hypothetical protein